MIVKFKFFLPLLFLSVIGWSAKASAHGTDIEYQKVQAVQIDAIYAGGQPMGNAQVTVYAPDDPSTPWTTGITDEEGQFTFVPDPSQPGDWEVKVRQAGHGDLITVPVGDSTQAAIATQEGGGNSEGLSWLDYSQDSTLVQKALLSAAGGWGFFGTALFFARRRKTA
ncbi:carboxypeptidase-like regulatory domain-containing protein [Coleofasciculus sp. LEGE 07092]|uniref:carboxypeptidase-like regulatory domain-containing protein n=2 Tax=unclassified Coleofasciculus TaxID=2692782 RepID=UPI001882EE95|nr:carboxypeptidase-like regulatory domain-containing protein [Coleofasciculus sp. LEGE 07092]MBE9128911.1 carboxypeptidase regulatory-like domain-containing protein [Coleofasciculus sp. LEGE 07081]MBE9151649.1 carboxypeptidase regulatory-like domain-containing protein [Coleofasciculus sp. LEGE 07092]